MHFNYLSYDEIGITISVIAIALAFVVLVWNAVKAIREWRQLSKKPTSDMLADHEKRITHLEGCCEEVQGKLVNDWQWQVTTSEMNALLLKSIKQLLKHSIDNNDRQGLIAMEEEIDNYLINHNKTKVKTETIKEA